MENNQKCRTVRRNNGDIIVELHREGLISDKMYYLCVPLNHMIAQLEYAIKTPDEFGDNVKVAAGWYEKIKDRTSSQNKYFFMQEIATDIFMEYLIIAGEQ